MSGGSPTTRRKEETCRKEKHEYLRKWDQQLEYSCHRGRNYHCGAIRLDQGGRLAMVAEARPTLYVRKEMDELTKWMEFITEMLTISISA
jgi:hypothetical protein